MARDPAGITKRTLGVSGLLLLSALLLAESPNNEPFGPKSASMEELNARCESGREQKIAPLRNAKIEQCNMDKRNDPAYCARFFRTFGDSMITPDGKFVPRLYNDLPECIVADQERRRRLREGEYCYNC
jgi:hypothetical protein